MTEQPTTDNHAIALADLAYVHGEPPLGAGIKREFSDFRVDEDLGFALTGKGDHLYVQVRKTDLSTTQTARRLAETTGIGLREVGYAGMKDRRGECSQWFSLKLPPGQEATLGSFENEQLSILKTARNQRKLRVGSHHGNRFRLLLRQCQGPRQEFERRLELLGEVGVPNYFGAQRFGRDMSNLQQVAALFARDEEPAGREGGRQRRSMLYSAARAYLFNQVLSTRIEAGNWCSYVEGDVLNLDDTDRYFVVDEGAWDETLQQRLETFDIHLSGPLAGIREAADKYISRRDAAALEEGVLAAWPALVEGLRQRGLQAARRPLRLRPRELAWHWQDDQENNNNEAVLAISFALPRGAYATSVLRELCQTHQP